MQQQLVQDNIFIDLNVFGIGCNNGEDQDLPIHIPMQSRIYAQPNPNLNLNHHQPLEALHEQYKVHAVAQGEIIQNLPVETVAEMLFERNLQDVVDQIARNVVVPITPRQDVLNDHQKWLLRMLANQLKRSLTPYNPYGERILERKSKSVHMEELEFKNLFYHLPVYHYPGRKLYDVPRYLTLLLSREQFISTFEPFGPTGWFKKTRRYSIYLKFPLLLTYNVKHQTAQFHFLVIVYQNNSGHRVENGFIRRPRRLKVYKQTTTIIQHTIYN